MQKRTQKGDKWAAMECIDAGYKTLEETDNGVTLSYPAFVYVLLCACGKQVEVKRSEFLGKRSMRDCGCGAGGTMRSTVVALSLPGELRDEAAGIASRERANMSRTCAMLLRLGIQEYKRARLKKGA